MSAGVWAKHRITEDLATYAAAHEDVQTLLDPLYLMFVDPLLTGFAAAVAADPTAGSPAPAPVLFNAGMPNIYQFAANEQGNEEARQFLEYVQAICLGQRVVTMFRTTVLPDIL
jgi:hypothetical protein